MTDKVEANWKRIIKQGLLMKRCRWCWRPRFIEIVSDPPDFSGPKYSFFLLIYDQSHRTIKKRIRIKDIVTIRAGKNSSFHLYLNSGMFILFRADSVESQASWMAELKMSLGRGNIFHVQVNTPVDNFVLDHALLYCIGVNLPNHKYGQLDRVLVAASPINDVNLHAWNLSRVKRFLIIEAGIQMELCGNCMGNRKKTVTFLIAPGFIKDCTEFLVKEARVSDEPKQMPSDGPIYYSLPHSCSRVAEGSEGTEPCPAFTNAEMIVLGTKGSANMGLYVNHNVRGRSFSTTSATVSMSSHMPPPPPPPPIETSTLPPLLPTRDILRTTKANTQVMTNPSRTTDIKGHFDHTPYTVNHRIYVNKSGIMTEDSHVFGSGSWEHSRHSKPPVIPPRLEESARFHPVYVHDNDICTPLTCPPMGFQRPDFIGRNPPCLPPRSTTEATYSPSLPRRSTSDSNLLGEMSSSPNQMRRNSEYPRGNNMYSQPESPPPPFSEHLMYQNVPSSHVHSDMSYSQSYTNYRMHSADEMRSPSPQLCTDDVTNAEFALITKLTFSGQVLPPRNQPRTPKRPIPVPRSKKTGTVIQCTSTVETDVHISKESDPELNQDCYQKEELSYSLNPMYSSLVGTEREPSSTSSSSVQTSPMTQKKIIQQRCNSFSSSSLSSEDYGRITKKGFLLKKCPHEV